MARWPISICLSQMPDLQRLSIYGVSSWTTAAVKTISQLSQLSVLDLYGTGVSAEVEQKAEHRTSGSLNRTPQRRIVGNRGPRRDSPCRVDDVQPNSAAEAADIRLDDEIVSFEGQPIHSFKEFTDLVAEKYGGDRVKLEIRRGEEVLTKQVTLGQW